MTTSTPNLALTLYNSTTDQAEYFSNFRAVIAGVSASSNFYKIDTAYGTQAGQITSLQGTRGAIYVPALYVSANYYEANSITEITSYTTNMTIILRLDIASAGTVTLNINSLGTKSVMKINSSGTIVNISAGELMIGKNYLFRYDGTQWVWVSSNSADQTYIAGTSGNIVTVNSDNTLLGTTAMIVKASGAELDTGTDDAKFATAKALKDSHNVPSVAPSTSGNVLTSNGTDWVSSTPSSSPYPCFTRCSLVSGDPNPITDQTAKTAVYVMPYNGNTFALWNGSSFSSTIFSELTTTLTSGNQLLGSVYDIYIFNDSGTIRSGFGVAWTSSVSRGTGAGTAETEYVNGVEVNKNSMTIKNGASSYTVSARYGTLVGTMSPSANGQVEWSNSQAGIGNKYNLLGKTLYARDSTDSWNYSLTTWRAANTSTTLGVGRVQFVSSGSTSILAQNSCVIYGTVNDSAATGIGIDSTSSNSAQMYGSYIHTIAKPVPSVYGGMVSSGLHYVQRLEISGTAGTTSWVGDGGGTLIFGGMNVVVQV